MSSPMMSSFMSRADDAPNAPEPALLDRPTDDAAACARDTFQQAQENCKARGGDLCRGNAVSTSMDDPSCPGSKTDYVWTLTKCDVNGVAGRVIRPSAGGAPGPLCETNTLALHQSRCCSNVC